MNLTAADPAGYQLLRRLASRICHSYGQSEGAHGEILALNHEYHVIIIGAGNIGRAVANYTGFAKEVSFNAGDVRGSPALVGIDVHGILVQPMEKLDAWMETHQGRYRGAGRSVCYAQTTATTAGSRWGSRDLEFCAGRSVLPEAWPSTTCICPTACTSFRIA